MNNIRKNFRLSLALICLFSFIGIVSINSYAADEDSKGSSYGYIYDDDDSYNDYSYNDNTSATIEEKTIVIDLRVFTQSEEIHFKCEGNTDIIDIRSQNSEIADCRVFYPSVGSCDIEGYKVGKTKIEIYNTVTGKVLASVNVEVVRSISNINFDETEKMELYVGFSKTRKLQDDLSEISFKPIWKSSNPKVAKVNSKGKVTGVKKGTATISVSVGKAKAKYIVKVKNPGIKEKKETVQCGGKKVIHFVGAKGKVKWKVKNKKIAKIKPGKNKCTVVGKKLGKTKLIAKYKGKQYSITIKIVKPKANFAVFVSSPYASTKYRNSLVIMIENKSIKPMIIHKDMHVVSDVEGLSGVASMDGDYVIKPGKKVLLHFNSEYILKQAPETAYVFMYTFNGQTYRVTYRPVNSLTGTVEYH